MPKRYIFFGDIHGCYNELNLLLEKINPVSSDEVYCTGDFLDRGDYPDLCIDLWIKNGYKAVLGNHDERVLRWRKGEAVPLAEGFNETLTKLDKNPKLINFLEELPLIIKIDNIQVVLVHAALNVNLSLKNNLMYCQENKDILLRGRYVRLQDGIYKYIQLGAEENTDILWNEIWNGPEQVVFGHTPSIGKEIKRTEFSICLDTGCAYGGYLSAAIFELNKGWSFTQTKAIKKYWSIAQKKDIVVI